METGHAFADLRSWLEFMIIQDFDVSRVSLLNLLILETQTHEKCRMLSRSGEMCVILILYTFCFNSLVNILMEKCRSYLIQ